jgi:hypothetical protein
MTPRANTRKRIATPHPKRDASGGDDNEMENEKLYGEAVKYTPFEYTTDVATFIVRRPYGNATDKEYWFQVGNAPGKQYEKTANAKKPSTLEVVAQINADGSVLSLHGDSSIRHMAADADDWIEFGSYDELDKPLGSITYIDSEANEKDYSLGKSLNAFCCNCEMHFVPLVYFLLSSTISLQTKSLKAHWQLVRIIAPLLFPWERA